SGGKVSELLHHLVDGLGGAQKLALEGAPVDIERHGLGEVSLRHRADHARALGGRIHEVIDERVDVVHFLRPEATGVGQRSAFSELAFLTYHLGELRQFFGHARVLLDEIVEYLRDPAERRRTLVAQARRGVTASQCSERIEDQRQFFGMADGGRLGFFQWKIHRLSPGGYSHADTRKRYTTMQMHAVKARAGGIPCENGICRPFSWLPTDYSERPVKRALQCVGLPLQTLLTTRPASSAMRFEGLLPRFQRSPLVFAQAGVPDHLAHPGDFGFHDGCEL